MSESQRLDSILTETAGDGDTSFILARQVRSLKQQVAEQDRQLKQLMELLKHKDSLTRAQQERIDMLVEDLRATKEAYSQLEDWHDDDRVTLGDK